MTAPLFPTSAPTPYFEHDADANLDYGWGFPDIVPTDTIASATFILAMKNPGGAGVTGATLTIGDIVNTPATDSDPQVNAVYGWLAITDMSLVGKRLAGTCRYTSSQGRVDERTLYFTIVQR